MIKHKKVEKISFECFKNWYEDYALSKPRENFWFALCTVDGTCDTRYCHYVHYVDILYVFDTVDYDMYMDECPYDEDSDEYYEYIDKITRDIFDAYYDDVYKEKIRDEYDLYCEWVDEMNESIESEW